ncbi:MAG TPA: protein kinase [Acidobacteriota bacterium]|nr:protein kinase [Acidobacteriota bacterium]HQM64054.1 protein kinase [Acidobacteriota bacterium]
MIERRILAALLRRGDISPEQLRKVLSVVERDDGEPSSGNTFLSVLEEADLLDTAAEAPAQAPPAGPDTVPLETSPSSFQATAAGGAAPQQVDLRPGDFFSRRYEIRGELGRGGMGVVYLAHDRLLRREVAVKIIEDPSDTERRKFLREASAQARVSHENVCRVYDAGEIEDRLFISMEHIRGDSLRNAAPGLSLAEKVSLIIQTADGMSAAHRMGLVHRDIKPGNIMVERTDDGPRARVVDFGLVREMADTAQTQGGDLAGTPLYMAPEQLQGQPELIDWRTDVYALGMTLYEAITGAPLFTGPTPIAVMLRILEEEPRFPRDAARAVPRDLQAIILKCVAKQPRDRYSTMRDLADDLRRFQDGKPVLARPVPLAVRGVRWIQRNQVLAFAIGAGAAVAITLATLWVGVLIHSREMAVLSRRFGEQVSTIERIHEMSMMMPLHDTYQEHPQIRDRMRWIRHEMDLLGDIAAGPGHYALGCGSMALDDWEEARGHFEAALRADPDDAASHFNLGIALSEIYRHRRMEALTSGDKFEQESRLRQYRREIAEPALRHIRLGVEAAGADRDYGEALIAKQEFDFDRAIRLAGAAWKSKPLYYPAGILQGWSYLDRGQDRGRKGDLEGAQRDLDEAGRIVARLVDNARSDPQIRRLESSRRLSCLYMASRKGSIPEPLFSWAEAACADLQRAASRNPQTYYLKAALLDLAAEQAMEHGQDPTPRTDAALQEIGRALEIQPDNASFWMKLAVLRERRNMYRLGQGEIDKAATAQCLEAIQRARQLNPNSAAVLNVLGLIHRQRGFLAMLEGADQRPALQEAIAALNESHRLDPELSTTLHNLALLHGDLALYELNYGLDPRESARQAMAWSEKAIARTPESVYLKVILTNAYMVLAIFDQNIGGDGTAIRRFLKVSQAAVQSNPDSHQAHMQLCQSNELLARWQIRRAEDPAAAIEAARTAGRKAVALNSRNPYCPQTLTAACLVDVEWRLQRGEYPRAALVEAETHAKQALRLNPADIEMVIMAARVERWQAAARLAQRQDPTPFAKAALARLDEADKMDAREPRVPQLQGECWLLWASHEPDPDQKRQKSGRAAASFREALRRNPYLKLAVTPYLQQAGALTGAVAADSRTNP